MFVRIVVIALLVTFLGWSMLARSSAGAGKAAHYVVRPRDTLWSIAAARYSGDVREGIWKLEQRNHLAGVTITPGQRLVVP